MNTLCTAVIQKFLALSRQALLVPALAAQSGAVIAHVVDVQQADVTHRCQGCGVNEGLM